MQHRERRSGLRVMFCGPLALSRGRAYHENGLNWVGARPNRLESGIKLRYRTSCGTGRPIRVAEEM